MIDTTKRYRVRGFSGVAFGIQSYDEEENSAIVVMVGDDRPWTILASDMTPLNDTEFCRDCGQIGCKSNVVEDDADNTVEEES